MSVPGIYPAGGYDSRQCVFCKLTGARTRAVDGYAHRRCIVANGKIYGDSDSTYSATEANVAKHGGRRNGAGRKPLDGGTVRVSYRLEPKYIEVIRKWRAVYDCTSDSAALRQILKVVEPLNREANV